MNILITGAKGFVGKNLTATLQAMQGGFDKSHKLNACPNAADITPMLFDIDSSPELLPAFCAKADFVVHLAGINRPKDPSEFYAGNASFTETLLSTLEACRSKAPVLVTSSIQAELENDYGKSKRQAEDAIFAYGEKNDVPVYVFRMEGVFGKWCRPNYNSVVATFCHNVARGLPIEVRDPIYSFPLVYIDDVVDCIIDAMNGQAMMDRSRRPICHIHPVHQVTLGQLADTIRGFALARGGKAAAALAASGQVPAATLALPSLAEDSFEKKLYSTYLSYLPEEDFAYDLKMNCDDRGSFTEFLRSPDRGQVSVNISKPGIVKGNHWHHTKNEKFLVVKGEGIIRLRNILTPREQEGSIIEYRVSGQKLQVVDIPCGYTHNIENLGSEDMVTVMWANEAFDPERPDTFFMPV